MLQFSTAKQWDGTEEHVPNITLATMAKDLTDNSSQLRANTLKLKRSALIHHIRTQPIDPIDAKFAMKILEGVTASASKAGKRITRKPGRMIPFDDFQKICNTLLPMKEWGNIARSLLISGLASGARPIEWIHAKWIVRE